MIRTQRVGVGSTGSDGYPTLPPYPPSEDYPELTGLVRAGAEPNAVYAAVRESFRNLGLDLLRAGTADWNPLGEIVRPGFRVLVKPNLVRHANLGPGGTDCLVTHGSVIRAVLDYVLRALEGRGEVVLGDAPIQSADFETLCRITALREIADDATRRSGVDVRITDFRRTVATETTPGLVDSRAGLPGDPAGYVSVDLGAHSLLAPFDADAHRFRVTGYDAEETPAHHSGGKHEYLLSRTALTADAVINLPKLKTHRKAGLTCSLKNLVGLNGDKAWLPHHRAGSVAEGGDEYAHPSARKAKLAQLDAAVDRAGPGARRTALLAWRRVVRASNHLAPFPDPYREGSWYGNDTVWRMALDLDRAALYARDGGLFVDERRPWLNVVDAIVCGENDGPLRPDPVHGGVILAGTDPAMVDLAAARMAGFDPERIAIVAGAFGIQRWPITDHRPEDLEVVPGLPSVPLRPAFGWKEWLAGDGGERPRGEDVVPAGEL